MYQSPNWRELIEKAMARVGETWNLIESNTLTDEDLEIRFNDGYGRANGKPFTIWTKNRVYFPVEYDGAEHVDSVSRNPDNEPTQHIGRYVYPSHEDLD